MRVLAAGVALLMACYQAPARNRACSLLCETTCPDEMTCTNGYCVASGERCEPTFESVHAGNGFACALDETQRRWCWGANDHHQIDASDETQVVYATLTGNAHWDVIASGGEHACGIRDGALYCWGGNANQQVAGGVIGDVSEPLRIPSPSGVPWRAVATGFNATCAIADRLYCWGAGEQGQLGTGSTGDSGVPMPVASEITDWESVTMGRQHACAISATGGLHCWGDNNDGELGVGDQVDKYVPTPVLLPGATSVAVAARSTCAVAAGQLYCWGEEGGSRLGDPALIDTCAGNRALPVLASGLTGWTRVTASQSMACALRGDEVWCWGTAQNVGGLGKGTWGGNGWGRVTLGASDVSVGWNANIDDTGDTADLDLACVIVDGTVQCWGDNRFGQLAQGNVTMHASPTEIAGDHRWKKLLASDLHTCGLTTDNELFCWGTMQQGQTIGTVSGTSEVPCGSNPDVPCTLGVPTRVPFQPTADEIAVGDEHTCARLGTTLTCWGANGDGQLGAPGVQSPYTVPGAWTKLYSVGSGGTCAVQNQETWCWGWVLAPDQLAAHDARLDGMLGMFVNAAIGDTVTRGTTRAAGCLLDPTNQLICFGDETTGQFGMTTPPTPVCGDFVCGIGETDGTCAADCVRSPTCSFNQCMQADVCTTSPTVCGDGYCNIGSGETCSGCALDCGACPFTPTGRTYTSFAIGIISGSASFCGVRPDGKVECWGRNGSGQVGALDTGTGRPIDPVYAPYELPGLSGCTAVAAGEATSCALCGGDIYCWGSHRRGTLGSGALTGAPITTPRKIEMTLEVGDRFVDLTSGAGYSCARTEQGRGFCWGFHRYGALGTGGTSANLPIAIKLAPAE
jgi:alpha-tubulin suppressor-like RCC1 family protein